MSLKPSQRFYVLNRDDFTCQYCGAKGGDSELHIDHIIARSRAGADDISNYATACIDCNLGRGDSELGQPFEDELLLRIARKNAEAGKRQYRPILPKGSNYHQTISGIESRLTTLECFAHQHREGVIGA